MLYAKLNHYTLPVVNLMHIHILLHGIGPIKHFLLLVCVSLASTLCTQVLSPLVAGEDGYLYEVPVSVDQGDANE